MIYPAWVEGWLPRVIIIRQPIKIAAGARVQHQFQLITCIFMSMRGTESAGRGKIGRYVPRRLDYSVLGALPDRSVFPNLARARDRFSA